MKLRLLIVLLALCAPVAALADETPVEDILAAAKFDLTSKPKGVPSQKKLQALWDAYKTAKQCFRFPTYVPNTPHKLKIYTADELASVTPRSPFPPAIAGDPTCNSSPFGKTLKPIVTVKLNEAYGNTDGSADLALAWLAGRLGDNRYQPDGESGPILRKTLLEWADAKALKKGINVSWGAKPIDMQMLTVITGLTIAYAETAAAMPPEERAKVGRWLNPLLANAARSSWSHADEHETHVAIPVLVWGLTVGDVAAVQWAIDIYKKQIHQMRPDGSFPIETGRSGAGLLYQSIATGNLVMMAAIAKTGLGVDLFDYSVDGRSIHNAVDFTLRTLRDPSLNATYALGCADGGDRWGTPSKPSIFWISGTGTVMGSSFLTAYAHFAPERENAKWIALHQQVASDRFKFYIPADSPPVCMMNARIPKP